MSKHIAVVGSRRFASPALVQKLVRSLPPGTVIVSGGASGPDTWGEVAAKRMGFDTLIFPAKWAEPCQHGDRCRRTRYDGSTYWVCQGFARNQDIVDHADEVWAFVADNRKGGTEDTIRKAKAAGKKIRAWLASGKEVTP